MSAEAPVRHEDALGLLRRFARRPGPREQCEMCSREVPAGHPHLVEPAAHRLLCVCEACAMLFPDAHARYKRVPRDIRYLPGFSLSEAQWDGLSIPIDMAFFYASSQAGRVIAVYPSPAGPTESLLPLDTWSELAAANSVLATLTPDVEALVVNRAARLVGAAAADDASATQGRRAECYILPIDQCYRLTGIIRRHWKGLSGGTEVWNEMAGFFEEMKSRARHAPGVTDA